MSRSTATRVRVSGSTASRSATAATKRSKPAGVLVINGRYATKLLELQREWLDEARRALRP